MRGDPSAGGQDEEKVMEVLENRKREPLIRRRTLVAVAAGLVAIVFAVALPRMHARAAVDRETRELAVRTVSVVRPKHGEASHELVLPAEVRPLSDAPIYARTSGYLKRWHVDIGAHVTSGQLLAEIDTPEVDQQLQQVKADLSTAEANARLAEITAQRYKELLKSDSVSSEDADRTNGDVEAKRAMLDAARSNLKRLQNLQSFQRIEAPFEGVITARNTDVGALVDAGSGGAQRELFHVAATSRLRVYANVPEAYSQAARPGQSADLTLAEFPGRRFPATLVRTAGAIDRASRTLLVELEVDNAKGELMTGSFASLHLQLPTRTDTYLLPAGTLVFRSEGLRVAMVKDGHAVFVPIVLGRDLGTEVEVLSGVSPTDAVMIDPADSLVTGEEVRVAADDKDAGKRP
jgi:RND family efflux transporter MFP subunit